MGAPTLPFNGMLAAARVRCWTECRRRVDESWLSNPEFTGLPADRVRVEFPAWVAADAERRLVTVATAG